MQVTDIECAVFSEPARAVIRTKWTDLQQVQVTKDTAVRVKGGIKSKVLQNAAQGDTLILLEALDSGPRYPQSRDVLAMWRMKR